MADLSVKKGELPLSALSAYSTIPTSRNGPKQFNYFQNIAKETNSSTYDRLFHYESGYNDKLHRCDREHAKSRALDVHKQEQEKTVPSLMSSKYGHRLDRVIDIQERLHVRVVKTREFQRNNGIGLSKAN